MSIKIYVKYVKNNRDFHTTKLNLPTGALDVATGEKVMKILEEMHKEGQTIILVTHDEKIAKNSERMIEVRDGRVV